MTQKKIRVLVVDDNKNFLTAFEKTLSNKGCIVNTTSDPEEACKRVLNDIYHVVFIDCILLEKLGIELAQKIRQLLGYSLEIIMMSGVISEKSITNFTELGLLDFLQKPISNTRLDYNLNRIQKKHIYNISDNFIQNIFSEPFSNEAFFQFLISLKKVSPAKFFLLLSGIFKSKEKLTLYSSLNGNTYSRFFFQKGILTGFEVKKGDFFNTLILQKLLSPKDLPFATDNKPATTETLLKDLIGKGTLSPYQTYFFQLEQLKNYLEEVSKQKEIFIKIEFFKSDSHYLEATENLLADTAFPYLKNLGQKDLETVFNRAVLHSSFKIHPSKNSPKYVLPAQTMAEKIQKGLRISAIQSEMNLNKKDCYLLMLYILLKGEAYFTKSGSYDSSQYLLERYKKLLEFLNKTPPMKVFKAIGNLGESSHHDLASIKNVYLMFLKSNHIDRFSADLPQTVIKTINDTTIKLKQTYNKILNPEEKKEETEKEKGMQKAIELSKTRHLCKSLLEKKDYKKAFSVINQVSKKDIEKDPVWMLLYIWLATKAPKCGVDRALIQEFKAAINLSKMTLVKNALYFYVLGLLCVSQGNNKKAILLFSKSKELDGAFQPAYEEYKLAVIEEKSKETTFFNRYFGKKRKKVS